MKKFLYIVMVVAIAVAVASCGGGAAATPGAAAKKYAQYMADGNYDKFIEGIHIPADTPAEEVEQSKAMLGALLAEKGSETLEEKGGIEKIEVLSEEIAEGGGTAVVKMRYTYGNGETSEEAMEMVRAGGEWKIELNK